MYQKEMIPIHAQPQTHRPGTEWIGIILALALLATLLQAGSPGFNLAQDGVWTLAKHFPTATQQKIERDQKQKRGQKKSEEVRQDQAIPVAADVPNLYLGLYQQHAPKFWEVVAGIYKIESDHGRSKAPGVRSGVNSFGCCAGPGQFHLKNGPPSTWDTWGKGGNVYDPRDSVPATVRMLTAYMKAPVDRACSSSVARGYSRRVVNALRHYNNACWYVDDVLSWAVTYKKAPPRISFTSGHGCDTLKDWRNRSFAPEVQGFMLKMAARFSYRVSCIRDGHSRFVRGTKKESAHWDGRAYDVDVVNGTPVSPSNPATNFAEQALAYGAKQVGGPRDLCNGRRCFTNGGHQYHWHVQP